jgi:3-oxoacyl-[acyl-carrier-protein] synthase-3
LTEEAVVVGIVSLGWHVPVERHHVDRLAADHGVPSKALRDFGLISVAVPAPDEHPSTLAARAVRHAVEAAGMSLEAIDLLIFAGLTRDRPPPWVAAFGVLHELGCTRATGFDIAARCPGIHDALWVAASLVRAGGFKNVMVACGDRFDYLLPRSRKKSQVAEAVYSAGGAAALVSDEAENEIVAYSHFTNEDLSIHGEMCPSAGGSLVPVNVAALADAKQEWQNNMRVDQAIALRDYLVRAERYNIEAVCRRAGFDAIDFVAVAPLSVRDQIASLGRLGIGPERILPTLPVYGHMGPADSLLSIGLAITSGRAVGPRLVMSTRSTTSANALAIRGLAPDLGIRVSGANAETPRGVNPSLASASQASPVALHEART